MKGLCSEIPSATNPEKERQMSKMETFTPFMGSLDGLTAIGEAKGKTYVTPALKSLGSVVIPVVREVIAPASFRNEQQEVTDIDVMGTRRVRAVANKFKFGERQRGLQVLRLFGAGGTCAQNKTDLKKGQSAGSAFDLNTVVFGDSTDAGGKVLPVKAAALYSDAISLAPYRDCVDETFHNRAAEDGTLFDAEIGANSNNIFSRHFVKPGTLLVQTIVLNGRTAPLDALDHLLLCIGLAGAYGGQTSISGINVRTHIAGIHAGPFEQDIASPYILADAISGADNSDPLAVRDAIEVLYADRYAVSLPHREVEARRDDLIAGVTANDDSLRARYIDTSAKVSAFFDAWFDGIRG